MIKAQDAARESLIRLERVVGLPLSEETVLTDDFQSFAIPIPTLEESIANALKDRLELQVAETLVNASMDDLKSEKAGYAPKLQVEGAYGLSGNVPKDSKEVGDIGAQLEVPLFNGGETRGKVKTARGHYEEAAARAVDTRRQIEEDVRLSLISLASSLDELETAQQTVQLAETELKMAKDRYSAGVGDNIQVLSAQTALAQAHATLVDALALTNVARVNLSMALGHVRSFKL
jgi:outer membrane protein TolC